MRLDPKLVHPSIFKATDGVLLSGRMYSASSTTTMKAVAEHQKIWFKEYGTGCILYCIGAVATIIGTVPIAHNLDKPWKGLFVFGVMLALAIVGMLAFWRNLRQITSPELAALLPILDLTETQRAYAETVIALERSGRSMAEIEETMTALNALLDEESRLIQTRDQWAGTQEGRGELEAERERIAARISGARDAEARLAFEQSLGLVDERLAAFDNRGSQAERIDAHLELLRQAVLSTRDAARHQSALPAMPDLGTDALRSAVALARAQSQETERALAELRAI